MPHGCPSDETVTFRKLVSSLSLQRPSIDRYSNFLKKTTKTILYFFKKYLSICYIKNLKSIKIKHLDKRSPQQSNKTSLGGFSRGSVSKESAHKAGDPGSVPGSRRSPGEGNGKPLQYSCLVNSVDRGAWQLQSMGLQVSGNLVSKPPRGREAGVCCRSASPLQRPAERSGVLF